MAVGKTTLAKIVAKNQNMQFIDIDKNIEKKNSMKIREIFEKKGENYFRTQEEKEVLESLKKNNCVIALGGGAFINQKIRENVLKNTISIWLDADLKELYKRTKWNHKRPLLDKEDNKEKIQKLYNERKNIYKLANHKIICKRMNKNSIAKKIISFYEKQ